jgi:hypothetical protein
MPTVVLGPRCNRRVTCDADPHNDRSESALAVNPLDPYNMVGASKRFTDPATYAFSLAAYATFDGGQTWTETVLPLTDTDGRLYTGTSDPAVAWDNSGNVYVVGLPFGPGLSIIGITIYQSNDGGRTWGAPKLIHSSPGDDKQWATGDNNPASPRYGNVYAVWDEGSQMGFARTTDNGATWKGFKSGGVDQPAGTPLPGISDSFAPEINVAADGTVYIVWINGENTGNTIKFVKSMDGGDTFSAPAVAASGITNLGTTLPNTNGWPHFSTAMFRVLTLATGCTGLGGNLVFAWADTREGNSRIYYRHSSNGGKSWNGPGSGQPLLTGALASAADKHDFHPQLANTPAGEIGCTFYEYGPTGGGEFPPNLINVILAVSTDNGKTFTNRVTVTERAWDPTLDAPFADGVPPVTFIGEYFGFAASNLGFFPFWTDTRTSIQEIFTARVAVKPGDLYIRDGGGDTGDVPSPDAVFWESLDIIVRRQPDGDVTFVNQDLIRDGHTDHYVYGRVTNRGPNNATVKLAVTVGNYPSLLGLPGGEFWYPQDWYEGDWDTAALQANHLYLGESSAKLVANGSTVILGPVTWPAAQIPPPGTWHPCLLGEVRSGGDDSAGGTYGCDIPADPADPCPHGSFVIGNNNACQRNLSYKKIVALSAIYVELPFIVGSVWDKKERFLEVVVDKGRELALTPMTLRMEPIYPPAGNGTPVCEPGEIVFTGKCRVVVRVGKCDIGEIITTPGTAWRPRCPEPSRARPPEKVFGGQKTGNVWQLTQPHSAVGFPVDPGELRKMTLSFTTPKTLSAGTSTKVRIAQRKDHKIITGGVTLELTVESIQALGPRKRAKR